MQRYAAPPGVSATSNAPKKPITGKPYKRSTSHPFKTENSNVIQKNVDLSTQRSSAPPRNTHTTANGTVANRLDRNRSPSGANPIPSGSNSGVRSRANSSDSLKARTRVNSIQSSAARSSVRIATQQQPGQDPGIVDGYVENVCLVYSQSNILILFLTFANLLQSPEVLKMQLHNAQTIMAVGRLKLMQYLAVLRKYIPGDSIHELHQTMDGIEEVNANQN